MYPGGKNGAGVYQAIINQMPPHQMYIEAFIGSGAIMRMKKPAISSIGIDADGDVLTAFSGDGIPNLTLIEGNAITWLAAATILNGDTLVYLDPPYLIQTRRQHRLIYRCELTEADHLCLLKVIQELPCMVIISGYRSDLYEKELQNWRVETFQTTNRAGDITTEYLWMNYPRPLELHDYRYLGTNFRERERIKRKKTRWVNRLESMDSLERYALMDALEKLRGDCHSGNGDGSGVIAISDDKHVGIAGNS
jgi:16S rRNA G966 N2-methylase RsmD